MLLNQQQKQQYTPTSKISILFMIGKIVNFSDKNLKKFMFTTERSNSATFYGARPYFLRFVAMYSLNSDTKFQSNRMLAHVFMALQKLVTYVILRAICPTFFVDFCVNYSKKAQKVPFFQVFVEGSIIPRKARTCSVTRIWVNRV